jgi:hypothetical protein
MGPKQDVIIPRGCRTTLGIMKNSVLKGPMLKAGYVFAYRWQKHPMQHKLYMGEKRGLFVTMK